MKHQGLKDKTISEHMHTLLKFQSLKGDLRWDEDKLIPFIKEHYNKGSQQKIVSSSLSKLRHYKGWSTDKIREFLREANNQSAEIQQEKMKS